MDPRFYFAHWILGEALELKGQLREALAEYKKAAELDDDPYVLGLIAQAYAKLGERDQALKILEQMQQLATHQYVADYSFALVHLALGVSAYAKSGNADIPGFHARSIAGGMFFAGRWVYFTCIINWDAPGADDPDTVNHSFMPFIDRSGSSNTRCQAEARARGLARALQRTVASDLHLGSCAPPALFPMNWIAELDR